MESILNSALEQICSEGQNGLSLQTLTSRLRLSPLLQQPLWTALLSVPSLKFFRPQNAAVSLLLPSFTDAHSLDLNLVADAPLRDSFLGLYDDARPECPHQRRTLERVAAAGSTGITQSQLSKELGIRGENFAYKLRRLECRGLLVKKALDHTNLVCLNRYDSDLGLGLGFGKSNASKFENAESRRSEKGGGDFIAELPIEHQIYEMVNEAGESGVIVFKVAERLGINRKENTKRIERLCSRFGMVMDKEKCGKTQVYRVWAPGKRNVEAANKNTESVENVGCSKFTQEEGCPASVRKCDVALASVMPCAAEGGRRPSQEKENQLESQEIKTPLQKRKRSSETASVKFVQVDAVAEPPEHQPGLKVDDKEGCAVSNSQSARFLWTEEADRQLVIQYVRRCVTLGAKNHHKINWSSLPDLPAPPSSCKRRMSYLKITNVKFRKSLMCLCNIVSRRYAKLLQKSQNRSFNQDECESTLQGSREGRNQNYSLSNYGSSLQEEPWDDFNEKNIKEVLEETLYHVRSTKSAASKNWEASYEEGSDLNANAEEDVGSGIDSERLSISPHVYRKSPFPTDSGKRAAKFAHWLRKKDRDIRGRGIDLPTEIQCGDLFHLFALVSSGKLSISPCLPDGLAGGEDLKSPKHKISLIQDQNAKRLKSLVAESGMFSRGEKGFPELTVSISRSASSKLDREDLFKDENHCSGNYLNSSPQNQISETINPGIVIPVAEDCSDSPNRCIPHPGNSYTGVAPDVRDVKVADSPSGEPHDSKEGKDISTKGDSDEKSRNCFGNSCMPCLPWINVDGTINLSMYEGLIRRVFGIVLQNPGILEGEIIRKMDALHPQSCKILLAEMIKAKHIRIREMCQTTTSRGPPAFLTTLSGTSLTQPNVVFRKHLFANAMSSFLL